MVTAIETNNIELHSAKAGVSILDDGDLKIKIISPKEGGVLSLNNYSAVVKISYGSTDFLFMGDAESEVENSLLGDDIDAEVLKVGHHGSYTASSKSFIQKVSPKICVISLGAGNSYGHPHDEALLNLKAFGAQIYRTDEVGTIVLAADMSENITIE